MNIRSEPEPKIEPSPPAASGQDPSPAPLPLMADPAHTLFLLDGMALAYRAHFALANNPIRTAAGRNTSAVYGFTNTLLDLLNRFAPTHLAVVFDTDAPTARHSEFASYKAQRTAMPEELSAALPEIKRLIRAFNFPVLELDGYEADDIIGTLAREAAAAGFTTYMVTPDKDFGQLVNAQTFIYRPSRMGDSAETLGLPEVMAKWGVQLADQVRDILGLWGDTSDNIPGVPGIGEKTAQRLIAQYGTLEEVLRRAGEQKGKLRESLEQFAEQARLSKRLATIDVQVPIAFLPDQLLVGPRDEPALRAIFVEFEFNTLGRRLFGPDFKAGHGSTSPLATLPRFKTAPGTTLPPAAAGASTVPPLHATLRTIADQVVDYQIVPPGERVRLNLAKDQALSIAGDFGPDKRLRGLAWSLQPGTARYLALSAISLGQLDLNLSRPALVVGHDLKPLLRFDWENTPIFASSAGVSFFDTALAHALISPELRHTLEFVAESLLGYSPLRDGPGAGQLEFIAALNATPGSGDEASARRAMEQADLAGQLHRLLAPQVAQGGQERVFYEIESPLLGVLAEMEAEGIRLDPAELKVVGDKLRADLVRLEESIQRHAGAPFNIGSPRQLGEVLFGKLALIKNAKKTKTGQFATDEATLTALSPLHPIVAEVLEHRVASKLLSTYIDALPLAVAADGRIHTTFYQLATSTGRLNSQDPNLQNIPIRTALGREIRRAFVPRAGSDYSLLSADYSQIELRLLAELTGDAGLREALASGDDIHRLTAARVFGVAPDAVSKEQRSQAKMVNYGISYGISAFGLAQRLGIARAEAKNLIDGYFHQYPGIARYMQETILRGRELGYVETITGRRRYLPELRSGNATLRAAAERNAINMPIQGSSADLIKLAMVQIAACARAQTWRSKLLLQVHDELVFDLYLPEKEAVLPQIEERMKHALPSLSVPLVVELGLGANWLEAH